MESEILAEVVKDPSFSIWQNGKAAVAAKVGMKVQDKKGRKGIISNVTDEWAKVLWQDNDITIHYLGTGFTPVNSELYTQLTYGAPKKVWAAVYKVPKEPLLKPSYSGFLDKVAVFDSRTEAEEFAKHTPLVKIIETIYYPINFY